MQFRVLGPLEVVDEGRPVPLGGPRAKALLAALILARARTVSVDQLVDLIWGEDPPPSAHNAVQVHVGHLRRALGESAGGADTARLVTVPPGYRLEASADELDVCRFEALVGEARTAMAADQARRAADLFRAGLALWRGEALADVVFGADDHAPAVALDEARLAAVEECIDAELASGRHAAVVPELEQLVEQHPLRERLRGQQMVALYRAGRQGDALDVYRRTRELLADELGIDPSPGLQELEQAILVQDPSIGAPVEPAVSVPDTHNLPSPMTSYVERPEFTKGVEGLVAAERMVTLVGPGGVGKTRAALQVAAAVQHQFQHTSFVDLSAVSHPDFVAEAVATALGVVGASTSTLVDATSETIASRTTLLVVDNCEHLVDVVAPLLQLLLDAGRSTLTVLATSREALGVPGESVAQVPPLGVADPDLPGHPDVSLASIALFLDRIRQSAGQLDPTADDVIDMAARICWRLDGMPLAIELAAARAGSLPLADIVTNLDRQIRLLTGGPRTVSARQQSLRGALDWSYDELDAREQLLFRGLSVFRSGFTLEAADAIAVGLGVDEGLSLELVPALVGHSLVTLDLTSSARRYRILEPLRQYAEHVSAPGERDHAEALHAAYFLEAAQAASEQTKSGPEQAEAAGFFDSEINNMRQALTHFAGRGDWTRVGQLALTLRTHWFTHGPVSEGMAWVSRVLAHSDQVPIRIRSRLHQAAGGFAYELGEPEDALKQHRAALDLFEADDDRRGAADTMCELGVLVTEAGDPDEGRRLLEESLAVHRGEGNLSGVSKALGNLGYAALVLGDNDRARRAFEEANRAFRELDDLKGLSINLLNLGDLHVRDADAPGALSVYGEAVETCLLIGNDRTLALCLAGLGEAGITVRDTALGVQLLGCACAALERLGEGLLPDEQVQLDGALEVARSSTSAAEVDAWWAEGAERTLGASASAALAYITSRAAYRLTELDSPVPAM